MGRAPCCDRVGLKSGRWTAEEDEILSNYIKANGEGSWRSLPKNAGLLRCGKSCRLRWINYLRPNLKRGNFSCEEEELIITLHESLGNRWSLIASHLPAGRTDNEIKNYWNSNLSRKIYRFRRPCTQSSPVVMDATKADIAKLKGGRTSRKAIEENKDTCSNKPVDNVSIGEAVPFPTNPLLEKETFNNTAIPSPCQDTVSVEEGTVENSMLCPTCSVEEEDDILAILENIENNGLFCLDDIMESGILQENEDSTVPILGEDKLTLNNVDNSENNGDLSTIERAAANEEIIESGNSNEDFEDLDPFIDNYKLDNLEWDWDWDWGWDDKDRDMSSWLWEEDNEVMRHDFMVA